MRWSPRGWSLWRRRAWSNIPRASGRWIRRQNRNRSAIVFRLMIQRRLSLALLLVSCGAAAEQSPGAAWKFVVGGDSRNCGDVVMPAVAAGANSAGAAFYWHLGDYRALRDFHQDLVEARRVAGGRPHTILEYQRSARDDFLPPPGAPL